MSDDSDIEINLTSKWPVAPSDKNNSAIPFLEDDPPPEPLSMPSLDLLQDNEDQAPVPIGPKRSVHNIPSEKTLVSKTI